MMEFVMGILALIVFLYRFAFVMIPMIMKSSTTQEIFKSLTLLV